MFMKKHRKENICKKKFPYLTVTGSKSRGVKILGNNVTISYKIRYTYDCT